MYKVNDKLIYKKEVCIVEEVKEKYIRNVDYYVLKPTIDNSLKIQVPTNK